MGRSAAVITECGGLDEGEQLMATVSWSVRVGLIARATRTGLLGIPIGAVLFGFFYLVNVGSLSRDVPQARAQVQSAFVTGVLQDEDYLPGDVGKGWHQFNDCLILWQAIDQRGSTRELSVSPLKQTPEDQSDYCVALRHFAATGAASGRTFYHRYVHGQTTLVRYLLPTMGVEQIRELFRNLLSIIVVCGIAVSLAGMGRGGRTSQSVVFLILFFVFGRFFGLESFGQSLSHGPSDIVQLTYLLFLAVAAAREGIGRRTAVVSAALFGAMVVVFEFLTGGVHLGLAAVIGALPFATRPEDNRPEVWLSSLVAFCVSAVTCVTLKYVLAVMVFGRGPILGAVANLKLYSGLGTGGVLQGRGLKDSAERLITGLSGLTPGLPLLAGLTVIVAVVAGFWGASRLLRSPSDRRRRRAAGLLLSNVPIAALLLLLSSHTITHSFFMGRTLAWVIGSGLALFALAILEEGRARPDRAV